MRKITKLLSLTLIVAMITGMFSACGSDEPKKVVVEGLIDMTKDEIELSYSFWQDMEIVEELVKSFEAKYPNITLTPIEFETATNNDELIARAAAKNLPDAFWILDGSDFAIENGILYDMTPLWENDPDAKKIIPGINEFKLGYFGTKHKWTTPVKYFPSTAFLNKQLFENENKDMPSLDWTWEEFEELVENMTYVNGDNKQLYGISEQVTVVTWYPVAADPDCMGEFGWNGTEFDLNNWAYGMNLEASFIKNGWKAPITEEELLAVYGENTQAQDLGTVAIRTDLWWTWEDLWSQASYIDNNVIYVPYTMPQAEDNPDGAFMAIMDFGGISSLTSYPREAYEVLKYMTWGTDGWKEKLKIYPEAYDEIAGRPMSKQNMPITTDEEVWEGFRAWHPGSDDEYGRGEYFDEFFKQATTANWTCWGGHQIPGFTTWLNDTYIGTINIDNKVLVEGVDATDYVEELTRTANEANALRLQEIEDLLLP